MFSVKYKGKQVSLGRFGEVESGDVIRLTTYEYANVKDDDDFSLVKADEYAKVKPLATPLFNLQRLAGVSKLYQTLDAMVSEKAPCATESPSRSLAVVPSNVEPYPEKTTSL